MLNVFHAAQERITHTFDLADKVMLSFSGGKDSTVLMHLVAKECRRRKTRAVLLFVDLEAQYRATIDHVHEMLKLYRDCFDVFWVALPLSLRNAVSVVEPQWMCWDPAQRDRWVRTPPENAITDHSAFPFFEPAMEFEDFVPRFSEWIAEGQLLASFVGIRTQESLRRWKALHLHNISSVDGKKYLNRQHRQNLVNSYPIYDWTTEDVWAAIGKHDWNYNRIYDLIYQSGRSIHRARICQPYGDDQRESLDLFRKCEPGTWSRVMMRVSGVNYGNIYAGTVLLGNRRIEMPSGHTWRTYLEFLLNTIPAWQKHWYLDKFADHKQKWDTKWQTYRDENVWKYEGSVRERLEAFFSRWERELAVPIDDRIHDEEHCTVEARHLAPSYRRLVKVVMKNDICCHGLDGARTPRLYYLLKEYEQKYQKIRK